MRAILVYPEFPDTFWSFKHALKFVRKRASMPPLGLLTVASMLPADWELRLIDQNVRRLRDADLEWANVALVSGMIVQREAARSTIARCKRAGLPVIAGGPLFTGEWEQFPEVDHLILNEGEITLPRFLADWSAGRAERIYRTEPEDYADVRQTPVPRWELADRRRYASMGIQFSRGCPFNCEFCNITALLGHRPRVKDTAQIIAELDGLYQLGWRGRVFFVDDNLIGNKRYLKESLLPALIEWRRGRTGMPFNTEASINLADDDTLMELMAAAGFDTVFVGIETPDEVSLAECNKGQNRGRDMIADVKRIQRAGMEVQGGFILGFDSDTASSFRRQIDFIQHSGIVTAMVGMLQALPETRLYDRLVREGRIVGLSTGDNVDAATNIIPQMGLEKLQQGYRAVLQTLYAPEHYYARIRTFLEEIRPPKFSAPIDFQQVMAVLRSAVRLGIAGKERSHYWRLCAWTIKHRPRLFAQAITLAIYGYHFRTVSERHLI